MIDLMENPRLGSSAVELIPTDRTRPPNSGGWGMLAATKSGTYVSKAGERTEITAGVTRVSPDYWLARERPELFTPADKRDTRTRAMHARCLQHVRQELERGMAAPRSTRTRAQAPAIRPALNLPGQPFKLPRRTQGKVLP